jgi:hypothetical protein
MTSSNSLQNDRLKTILSKSLCPDKGGDCWQFKLIDVIVVDDVLTEITICFIHDNGTLLYYTVKEDGNYKYSYTNG